jgi:hypothetical protein
MPFNSSLLFSGKLPAGVVAQDSGLATPLQAAKAILTGEAVALSRGQWALSGLVCWARTAGLVWVSWEAGVGVGSLFYPGMVEDLAR